MLYPLIWVLSKILEMIPVYGNAVKAINGDHKISRLEKLGRFDEARRLRTNFLKKFPVGHLGPLWRSEGMDQLYNKKNYAKALEAFENAIICIQDNSLLSAFQYGVTKPFQVYYGAAVSAIHISDKKKAKIYYECFKKLVNRSSGEERYKEQLDWLRSSIDYSSSQTVINN